MRVTQGMMTNQLLRNINNNMKKLNFYENQLSTGRKINRPSDDPVGITYALRYRSDLSMNEQYRRNIDAANSFVDYTDTVMNSLNDIIQRAKELTVRGLSGTHPDSALQAIGEEIGTLFEQAVALGNERFNGKYIFNGQLTDKPPFAKADVEAGVYKATDDGKIDYQMSANVTIAVNTTGNEVFGRGATDTQPPEDDHLLVVLSGLRDAFINGDQDQARQLLDRLESRFDKFLEVRAEIGAKANRIELMDNRLKDLELNLTDLKSKTEDADIAAVIIKLQSSENIYQASLATGAKIIQPSLVDFLR